MTFYREHCDDDGYYSPWKYEDHYGGPRGYRWKVWNSHIQDQHRYEHPKSYKHTYEKRSWNNYWDCPRDEEYHWHEDKYRHGDYHRYGDDQWYGDHQWYWGPHKYGDHPWNGDHHWYWGAQKYWGPQMYWGPHKQGYYHGSEYGHPSYSHWGHRYRY